MTGYYKNGGLLGQQQSAYDKLRKKKQEEEKRKAEAKRKAEEKRRREALQRAAKERDAQRKKQKDSAKPTQSNQRSKTKKPSQSQNPYENGGLLAEMEQVWTKKNQGPQYSDTSGGYYAGNGLLEQDHQRKVQQNKAFRKQLDGDPDGYYQSGGLLQAQHTLNQRTPIPQKRNTATGTRQKRHRRNGQQADNGFDLDQVFGGLGDVFSDVTEWVDENINESLGTTKNFVDDLWGDLQDGSSDVMQWFDQSKNDIEQFLNESIDWGKSHVRSADEWIKQYLDPDELSNPDEMIQQLFGKLGEQFPELKAMVDQGKAKLHEEFGDELDWVKDTFQNVSDTAERFTDKYLDPEVLLNPERLGDEIKGDLQERVPGLMKFFEEAPEKAKEIFGDVTEWGEEQLEAAEDTWGRFQEKYIDSELWKDPEKLVQELSGEIEERVPIWKEVIGEGFEDIAHRGLDKVNQLRDGFQESTGEFAEKVDEKVNMWLDELGENNPELRAIIDQKIEGFENRFGDDIESVKDVFDGVGRFADKYLDPDVLLNPERLGDEIKGELQEWAPDLMKFFEEAPEKAKEIFSDVTEWGEEQLEAAEYTWGRFQEKYIDSELWKDPEKLVQELSGEIEERVPIWKELIGEGFKDIAHRGLDKFNQWRDGFQESTGEFAEKADEKINMWLDELGEKNPELRSFIDQKIEGFEERFGDEIESVEDVFDGVGRFADKYLDPEVLLNPERLGDEIKGDLWEHLPGFMEKLETGSEKVSDTLNDIEEWGREQFDPFKPAWDRFEDKYIESGLWKDPKALSEEIAGDLEEWAPIVLKEMSDEYMEQKAINALFALSQLDGFELNRENRFNQMKYLKDIDPSAFIRDGYTNQRTYPMNEHMSDYELYLNTQPIVEKYFGGNDMNAFEAYTRLRDKDIEDAKGFMKTLKKLYYKGKEGIWDYLPGFNYFNGYGFRSMEHFDDLSDNGATREENLKVVGDKAYINGLFSAVGSGVSSLLSKIPAKIGFNLLSNVAENTINEANERRILGEHSDYEQMVDAYMDEYGLTEQEAREKANFDMFFSYGGDILEETIYDTVPDIIETITP